MYFFPEYQSSSFPYNDSRHWFSASAWKPIYLVSISGGIRGSKYLYSNKYIWQYSNIAEALTEWHKSTHFWIKTATTFPYELALFLQLFIVTFANLTLWVNDSVREKPTQMNFSAKLCKELHMEPCDGGCVNISNRIYLSLSENQERRRPVIDEQI